LNDQSNGIYYSENSEQNMFSEAVKHQATIKPSSKALHHETISQICNHNNE